MFHNSLCFIPCGCGGHESCWGGSLVQPERSRGSPNPQLYPSDLAPLKSQHRAALFGTTQRCVSQFVSSAAFPAKSVGWFFFFPFQLFPSETCLWPSGFDRLLAPLPPPANDMVAETPALSLLPFALPLQFETCWEGCLCREIKLETF